MRAETEVAAVSKRLECCLSGGRESATCIQIPLPDLRFPGRAALAQALIASLPLPCSNRLAHRGPRSPHRPATLHMSLGAPTI